MCYLTRVRQYTTVFHPGRDASQSRLLPTAQDDMSEVVLDRADCGKEFAGNGSEASGYLGDQSLRSTPD
jgi:hypothetical protein